MQRGKWLRTGVRFPSLPPIKEIIMQDFNGTQGNYEQNQENSGQGNGNFGQGQGNFQNPMYTNDVEKYMQDYEKVVGPSKVDYFIPRFLNFVQSDNKIAFNWPALLFTSLYFMYRKLYVESIAIFVVSTIISYALPKIGLITLVINILAGLFFNYLYFLKAEKTVKEAQSIMNERERDEFLHKKGGTSVIAMIILLVASVLLGMIMLKSGFIKQ